MVKINYKVKTLNMISYLSSDQIFINYTEEGHRFKIGTILRRKTCCLESFDIINEKDEVIYTITQSFVHSCKISYKFNCTDCQNIDFEVLSNTGQFLSKIEKVKKIAF